MSSVDVEGRVIGQENAVLTSTPNGTSGVCGIQNHITPEGLQEDQEKNRCQEPDTPCKVVPLNKHLFGKKQNFVNIFFI